MPNNSDNASGTSTWILIATNKTKNFAAETTVSDPKLIYRAVSKWLIRGGASNILHSFWEYLDQYDNELEDALLDQLVSQAETNPEDPQVTNVRTKDYSIDMTVHAKSSNPKIKSCKVDFVLYVYFQSVKKNVQIDDQTVNLTMVQVNDTVEKVSVTSTQKTPAVGLKKNRRVKKRSSKVSTENI